MHFSKVLAIALATATTVVADKLEGFKGYLSDSGLNPAAVRSFQAVIDKYGRGDNLFTTTTEQLTKYARDFDLPFGHPDDWVVVDLRTIEQYNAQHIDDSVSFPVNDGNVHELCDQIRSATTQSLPSALKKVHYKKYVIFNYERDNIRGAAIAAAYYEYIMRNGKAGLLNALERQSVVMLMGSFKDVVRASLKLKSKGEDYLDFDPDLKSSTTIARRFQA
ncbi:hypothetical protein ABW19_dt0204119 [Dactylella cylindrospora]|nr:hypothetical protein ABW19_dt0204119 [Dactylella cylindrospora]